MPRFSRLLFRERVTHTAFGTSRDDLERLPARAFETPFLRPEIVEFRELAGEKLNDFEFLRLHDTRRSHTT